MRFFIILVLVPATVSELVGQCPAIRVEGPSGVPTKSGRFTAVVDDLKANGGLTYKWTLSGGKLLSGQGSRQIDVGSPNGVTATVEIGGLPSGCPKVVSASIVWDPPFNTLLLVSSASGTLSERDVRGVVEQLLSDPTATGYMIIYGPTKTSRSRMRQEIIAKLSIASTGVEDRIVVRYARRSASEVKLYLVPAGGTNPKP